MDKTKNDVKMYEDFGCNIQLEQYCAMKKQFFVNIGIKLKSKNNVSRALISEREFEYFIN